MVVDVVASLHPAIHPIFSDGLDALAEATPVMAITVTTKPAFL
jgi:hypothetical protein